MKPSPFLVFPTRTATGHRVLAALGTGLVLLLLLIGVARLPVTLAAGDTRYVDGAGGNDSGDCLSPTSPCQTITYASEQAVMGDSILVAGGIYTENLSIGRMLTLAGGYDAGDWSRDLAAFTTTIDGSASEIVMGDWDGRAVRSPAVMKDGEIYKMWYDGHDLLNDVRQGVATSTNGLAWTKAEDNPIFTPDPDSWESQTREISPFVLKEEGVYKMWYEGNNGQVRQLGYATSSDGVTWTRYGSTPVLTAGPEPYDSEVAGHGTVLHDGDLYKLWYHALGNEGPLIAYATSPDGINWSKQGPVLRPQGGVWDEGGLWGPSVIKCDTCVQPYWMWYSGAGPMGPAIGLATSPDGLNWTRAMTSPVLMEESPIGYPRVIRDDGEFKMYYTAFAEGVIKLAVSSDGITWTPIESNPVLVPGELGQWSEPVVTFREDSDGSVIDGFVITGGRSEIAGGILAEVDQLSVRNCVVHGNRADGARDAWAGGGLTGSTVTIENSVIMHNDVNAGASAVRTGGGQLTLINSLIAQNAGDAAIHSNGPVSLLHGTIADNEGGVLFNPPEDSLLKITNTIINGNQWSISANNPETSEVSYSIIEGGWPGEGNQDANPHFVAQSMGDYHLQPWSPAIDAGTPAGAPDHDLEGVSRPQNDGFDIGAFEFTGTPIPNEGDRFVALGGSDDGPNLCLDAQTPCATIGHAVTIAQPGETIHVAAGTYQENIEISGQSLVIDGGYTTGAEWSHQGETTVVDGGFADRVFYVHNGSHVVLDNLVITRGTAPEEACWGAGVNVSNGLAIVRNSTVENNRAHCTSGMSGGGAGGGLNAVADEGPATLHVENSYILNNDAGDHGSALATDNVTVVFTNVVASGNSQHVLAIHQSSFRMVNSTIVDNHPQGHALLDFDQPSDISILNSIIRQPGNLRCGQGGGTCEVNYSDIEGGWPGEGNIDMDPQFVDATMADFRLLPTSPAIDAGSADGAPENDLVGNLRDAYPDMGAFEWSGSRLFLPTIFGTPIGGGVYRLIGEWEGEIIDFSQGIDLELVIHGFNAAPESPGTYVGSGYAVVGQNATLVPATMQAVETVENHFDLSVWGASAVGDDVSMVLMRGSVDVSSPALDEHDALGDWQSQAEMGAWHLSHHSLQTRAGPPVDQVPGFYIDAAVTRIIDCDSFDCHSSTDYEIQTNVPSAAGAVLLPDSSLAELEPTTDIFTPEVDFVTAFRFAYRGDGSPVVSFPYAFQLVDGLDQNIEGAQASDTWMNCSLDPARNHGIVPNGGGTAVDLTVSWDPLPVSPSWDPLNGLGHYQVEIGLQGGGPALYGGREVKLPSHLIPWQSFGGEAPGSPDGIDLGSSLSELPDGIYRIQIGSFVGDCMAADHGAERHFQKNGNVITIFEHHQP